MTDERREDILNILMNKDLPITGTELARKFDVSRQVIVQDIAVLRASGHNIIAASNGYFVPKLTTNRHIYSIYSNHNNHDDIEKELSVIVDNGGRLINVQIEHPIYGEIVCPLLINNRRELDIFLNEIKVTDAKPLSCLTDGEHIHSIEAPDERTYKIIMDKLVALGFAKDIR